jgi:5-oxoprolinase (ATP-hydrolysing)
MPVHLGSMSESIKTVVARNAGRMQAGDVYVLNDPYHGGTHLPDVTVVTPVYLEPEAMSKQTGPPPSRGRERVGVGVEQPKASEPTFYVGSEATTPTSAASRPARCRRSRPASTRRACRSTTSSSPPAGHLHEAEMLALLRSGAHPSRNPEQNLGDLKAQIAANEKGVQELRKMTAQFGLDVVQAYMRHVQDNAEESVRRVITKLRDGAFTLELDNGAQIRSRSASTPRRGRPRSISPARRRSSSTTSTRRPRSAWPRCSTSSHPRQRRHPAERRLPEAAEGDHPGRLDAEPASAGFGRRRQRRDLDLHHERAVRRARRGRVEPVHDEQLHVRQRAPPVLRDDLGRLGRRADFDGTSVVQTHMTNSRLTDPEVLEFRFPVRLDGYEVRAGSGGAGPASRRRRRRAAGPLPRGDDRVDPVERPPPGRVRRRRRRAGRPGVNRVERRTAGSRKLDHIGSVEMEPGDVFVIETPGGGGYGTPVARPVLK